MTKQWYNPNINQLQTMPPWGSGWVADSIKESFYNLGWQEVDSSYRLPQPVKPFAVLKAEKLQLIDTWTAAAITGGFQSAATGERHTYDSDVNDQFNLHAMFSATLTAAFETAAPYYGVIPIRAIPQGETEKVILQHNKAQMEQLFKDLALHIGACKQKGWQLQQAVVAAETAEELANIKWPE